MGTGRRLVFALIAAACGGDSSDQGEPSEAETSATTSPTSDSSTSSGTTEAGSSEASSGGPVGNPSPGCGTEAPSGSSNESIMVGDQSRDYILVVPEGYDPEVPYPLVFAWHARFTSGSIARAYYGVEEASNGGAVFVYPDGLVVMGDGTGWDLTPGGQDVQLFDVLANHIADTLCIDLDRLFSTGHSFGGYMSNAIGCYRGDFHRAIAPVAGGGPFAGCSGQVAAWIAHGMSDATVPFSEGEGSRDYWAGANSCSAQTDPIDPAPCEAFGDCDAQFPVVWCAHDEPDLDGHGWPLWAGPAIWEFFDSVP